jgi:hypothetical protein
MLPLRDGLEIRNLKRRTVVAMLRDLGVFTEEFGAA